MTILRRQMIAQTRRLVDTTHTGNTGGTVADVNTLTINVTIPQEYRSLEVYVVYDVKDDDGEAYSQHVGITDGVVTIQPSSEVLRRVSGNRLTYQIVLTDHEDLQAASATDTVTFTEGDSLMMYRSVMSKEDLSRDWYQLVVLNNYSNTVTVSGTEPSDPVDGDLWFDTEVSA